MYRRIVALLLLASFALLCTGCFDSNPDETAVPWSRPKDWERGAPGLGGAGF